MNASAERRVHTIRSTAEDADRDYDVDVDTYDPDVETFNERTTVVVDNGWERFEVVLGPRGGLKRAKYNTSGWGEGDFVKELDTISKAYSRLLTAIKKPEPIDE